MEMLVPIFWLIVGFVLLIKGGDWFVDGASGIARRFHLPEILIGATVVSIGTTLPEVMVSAGAAAQGSGSIAYGNAIGSIICNTALISAITIAIKPGPAARKSMILPVGFFFGAATLYCVASYMLGTFSRMMGIILLAEKEVCQVHHPEYFRFQDEFPCLQKRSTHERESVIYPQKCESVPLKALRYLPTSEPS